MNIVFRQYDHLILLRPGRTTNAKIAPPDETIVQTYSFSHGQFVVAQSGTSPREFFSFDEPVCLDCPFAVNNGAKVSSCYTHKYMQYSGFLSSLKAIGRRYKSFYDIPELDVDMCRKIIAMCLGRYVRFGSYGEPTLIPFGLVEDMCAAADRWTGYTHQYVRHPNFADYFMASTHGAVDTMIAESLGYRCFASTHERIDTMTHCPASKESGKLSNCSKCWLCSGKKGKGNKHVNIILH